MKAEAVCGSWCVQMTIRKGGMFFSTCVDRALGVISDQAWTEIMTVRSGSA